MIDLRSDTVTKPTPEMRQAMANAEVGDDVYQEDPTVNRLEERAAEITGKEAALFVPTGTMGNTIATKLHTTHGQEVIAEARGHLLNYELAMVAWFCGCVIREISSEDGILTWPLIRAQIKSKGPHWAPTGLIELENTHNMAGGTVYPMETLNEVCREAHNLGLPVHLDGARIFNAAVALGLPVSTVCQEVDTVMFCLSKGLGAPVGSMLAGSKAAMDEARLYRKRLGGGMRQAGVLAAAGMIALEKMPERLHEDHANARHLAQSLAEIRGITLDPARVQTNIVIFDVTAMGLDGPTFSRELFHRSVAAGSVGTKYIRMVTHYDVSRSDIDQAVAAVRTLAASRESVGVS